MEHIKLGQVNTVNDVLSSLQSAFSVYENDMKEFFSNEKDNIQRIYSAIRENTFPFNKVIVSDSNIASHMYKKYAEGMLEYAMKVADLQDTDQINPSNVETGINKVSLRDQLYIDSIFGGEQNPKTSMDIDSAMKNIEVIIDMKANQDSYLDMMKIVVDKIHSTSSEVFQGAKLASVKMMFDSMSYYEYKAILEIINCYKDICASLETRASANPAPETPKYQVF